MLISTPNVKRYAWPLAVVLEPIHNSLGEVSEVILLKGNGSKVRKHVSELILLFKPDSSSESIPTVPDPISTGAKNDDASVVMDKAANNRIMPRQSAKDCVNKNKLLSSLNLV